MSCFWRRAEFRLNFLEAILRKEQARFARYNQATQEWNDFFFAVWFDENESEFWAAERDRHAQYEQSRKAGTELLISQLKEAIAREKGRCFRLRILECALKDERTRLASISPADLRSNNLWRRRKARAESEILRIEAAISREKERTG